MNQEQIISILRQIMLVVGGGLVTKGYVDATTLNTVIGALLALGASGWAIYTRRPHGVIASAADQEGVLEILTKRQSTADAIPSAKVVGPSGA